MKKTRKKRNHGRRVSALKKNIKIVFHQNCFFWGLENCFFFSQFKTSEPLMLSLEYLTGYGTPDEEPPAYDDDQSSLSETVQDEYDYDYHKKILDDQTTVFF